MNRLLKFAACGIACLFCCPGLVLFAQAPPGSSGTWAPAGNMVQPRTGASAALLPDGRALVTGGNDGTGPTASAELYSSDGSFTPAASMPVARSRHVSVALYDGRVLVTGGTRPDGAALRRADIYDPSSNRWTTVGPMLEARVAPTASLMRDGRVLVAGGESPGGIRRSVEIFDPATGVFSSAGLLSSRRTDHAAAVLHDGRVLILGGFNGTAALASSDIFNPETNTVTRGPNLSSRRAGASATTLLNGSVLIAGGSDGASDLASAEVYELAGNRFLPTARALETPRRNHLAFLLPHNNNVLIVGGTYDGVELSSAELYASWNDAFSTTGSMSDARPGAAGSSLKEDGLLLVAGGGGLDRAEMYSFATVKTDKDDYAPGETVTISGSGWEPWETVTLLLQEVPETHEHRVLEATADENGRIVNDEFQPDAHDVGVRFYLTASGANSQAQTTFTDADIHFSQCRNDSDNDDATDDCAWSTGAINQNNSFYTEGDAVPQRLFHTIETAGVHTIRFEYDFTKSDIYAYDFLTNVDDTQSGSNLNECGDLPNFVSSATCSSLFSGPDTNTFLAAIPPDPFDNVSTRENPAARFIRIGGVSGATVSFPSLDGVDDPGEGHDPDSDPDCFQNCGTTSVLIDVTFTTTADDTIVGVWFGGHLAEAAGSFGWGTGFGASSISGSPFHISYVSLDGDAVGRRDNQISAGAVVAPSCPASCDDGNACNGTETCNPATGACESGTPVSCDDGNACNGTETCSPETGLCLPGTAVVCDDADACNGTETCNPETGACESSTPVACDDGNACNGTETCIPATGLCLPGIPVVPCAQEDPPTTTTVSCNPSTAARVVPTDVETECTAEVSDVIVAGPFATGTVSFFADGAVQAFATCAIDGSAQVQTCSVIYRTSVVGSHPIVAVYGGDATHTPSAGATVFTVTQAEGTQADVPQASTHDWAPASPMGQPRTGATATLLPDGRVLITGGDDASGASATAELYALSGDSFSAAAPMLVARSRHTAVLMPDGRVLVAGGTTTGGGVTDAAEIYDPAANSWSPVGNLVQARSGHTASLLTDGRVLIAGGDGGETVRETIEIFDPATNSFATAGTLSSPRKNHAAAVLQDGRVLVVGGSDGSGALSSSDVFNPDDSTMSRGPELSSLRAGATATTLLNGTVVVAGGNDASSDLASAEIYDPATNTFTPSGAVMETARRDHLAILLPHNHNVLIFGGTSNGVELSSAELFASWYDVFSWTGSMSMPRLGAAGSAMREDGRLLVAGGSGLDTADVYHFATLKTDKPDYAPGETVTISGSGWQPGETVTLVLQEEPKIHEDRVWETTADESGRILNTDFQPEQHHVGARFYLAAGGSYSQAQTTFTDNHIAVDNASSGTTGNSTATSLTFQHTVSGNANGLLIVGVSINNNDNETVQSITYAGDPLTRVGFQNNSNDVRIEIWQRLAPDAGTNNVVVTLNPLPAQTAAAKFVAGAVSFSGVNQTTPLGLFVSAFGDDDDTASVTVPGVGAHDLVVDTIGVDSTGTISVGTGQTSRWNAVTSGGGSVRGGGSTEPGPGTAGNVTMSWTNLDDDDNWALGAVAIKPQCAATDSTCDGVDDDCDGQVDEDYVQQVTTCGTGACTSAGTTSCVDGDEVDNCTPGAPAETDLTCDGVDDDCDGSVDEDYLSRPTTCGTGACVNTGATSCVNGSEADSCTPGPQAADDSTCDLVDDDCDGSIDEDYAPQPTTCGAGACTNTGTTSCVAGRVVDSCVPGVAAPVDATCNGVDDDCDGSVDDDYVSRPTTCGTGACSSTGETSCVDGTEQDSCRQTCGDDPPTTTTVSCDPSSGTLGLTATSVETRCTAEVSDVIELGPFATGTVSFYADGATQPFGTCTIYGSAKVQTCSVVYRTSVLGPHPIVAVYGGDATHTPSSGATLFTVTVASAELLLASNDLRRPFRLPPRQYVRRRRSRRRRSSNSTVSEGE